MKWSHKVDNSKVKIPGNIYSDVINFMQFSRVGRYYARFWGVKMSKRPSALEEGTGECSS